MAHLWADQIGWSLRRRFYMGNKFLKSLNQFLIGEDQYYLSYFKNRIYTCVLCYLLKSIYILYIILFLLWLVIITRLFVLNTYLF